MPRNLREGTDASSDRHDISIPRPRTGGRASVMTARFRPDGRPRLSTHLLNSFDPPRPPVARTIVGVVFLLVLIGSVGLTSSDIRNRTAFDAAPACTASIAEDPAEASGTTCRASATVPFTDARSHFGTRGESSFSLVLAGDAPANGLVTLDPPGQAFEAAVRTDGTVTVEIFGGQVVAVSAAGITAHSDKWPSTVVWGDAVLIIIEQLVAWALLRSAGRALWWRALGGRSRGAVLTVMRLIDLTVAAIAVAGAVLIPTVGVGVGVALVATAQVLLLLALLVPRLWARRFA